MEGDEIANKVSENAARVVDVIGNLVGGVSNKKKRVPGYEQNGMFFQAKPVDQRLVRAGLRGDPKNPDSMKKIGRIG
jgi:hypothetical protein